MARLPQITTREDVAPDHRHIVDEIAESRGRISGPFAMLLHSPEIAGRAAHLGAYIRFNSILDPAVRELAIITAAVSCSGTTESPPPLSKRRRTSSGIRV